MTKPPFELLKVKPADDGNPLGMTIEVQPEFEEWFLKAHGLTEWDEDKFTSWFKGFLNDAVKDNIAPAAANDTGIKGIDLYSREGLDE